jgi:hypothetical protein
MFRIRKPDYGVPLSIRFVAPVGLRRRGQMPSRRVGRPSISSAAGGAAASFQPSGWSALRLDGAP